MTIDDMIGLCEGRAKLCDRIADESRINKDELAAEVYDKEAQNQRELSAYLVELKRLRAEENERLNQDAKTWWDIATAMKCVFGRKEG